MGQRAEVAAARPGKELEATRLLPNPTNLSLVAIHGGGFGNFNPPAPVFLLPELRDNPESDERVMQVFGKRLRCDRELDARVAPYRIDRAIAAHQNPYEFPERSEERRVGKECRARWAP